MSTCNLYSYINLLHTIASDQLPGLVSCVSVMKCLGMATGSPVNTAAREFHYCASQTAELEIQPVILLVVHDGLVHDSVSKGLLFRISLKISELQASDELYKLQFLTYLGGGREGGHQDVNDECV